jgi:hypothetical protein
MSACTSRNGREVLVNESAIDHTDPKYQSPAVRKRSLIAEYPPTATSATSSPLVTGEESLEHRPLRTSRSLFCVTPSTSPNSSAKRAIKRIKTDKQTDEDADDEEGKDEEEEAETAEEDEEKQQAKEAEIETMQTHVFGPHGLMWKHAEDDALFPSTSLERSATVLLTQSRAEGEAPQQDVPAAKATEDDEEEEEEGKIVTYTLKAEMHRLRNKHVFMSVEVVAGFEKTMCSMKTEFPVPDRTEFAFVESVSNSVKQMFHALHE